MSDRLKNLLEAAIREKTELERLAGSDGGFAHQLALRSISAHVDDLAVQLAYQGEGYAREQLELRVDASFLGDGSIPLRLLSVIADEFRKMAGFAALRVRQGIVGKSRVSADLYNELDLRLAGILPGSSRLVITSAANRDLLNDGLAKSTFERFFEVLQSAGEGPAFLEAASVLGPRSSKHLKEFITLLARESVDLRAEWRFHGDIQRSWTGSVQQLSAVASALDSTTISERAEVTIDGIVELLSKRERIQVRSDSGDSVKILFPKSLFFRSISATP